MGRTKISVNDISTALYPAHIFETCIGLSEFTVRRTGAKTLLDEINHKALYKSTVYVTITVCTVVFVYVNDFLSHFKHQNIFYFYVGIYDLHCDLFLVWIMLITSSRRRKTLTRTWRGVMVVDESLSELNLAVNNGYVRRISEIWIFLSVTITTIMHLVVNEVTVHQTTAYFNISNVIYFIANMYKVSLVCTFATWLLCLKIRFEILYECLHESIELLSAETVLELEKIYQELCEIVQKVGEIYSAPVMISISMDYFVVIFQIYELVEKLVNNELAGRNLIIVGLFVAFFTPHTILLVFNGSLLAGQENLIKEELYKLAMRTKNAALKKEINAFSLQLLHSNVTVTAGGLFAIDWSLIFKMVSAGTTYLVILVQFNDLTF